LKKVLWLYEGEDNVPLPQIQAVEEKIGVHVEVRSLGEDFSSENLEQVLILGSSFSWHRERLLEFALQRSINPLQVRFFPWQEVQRIFPTTASKLLEHFLVETLKRRESYPAQVVKLLPERKVLVLPRLEKALQEAFFRFGIPVYSPQPPFLVERDGVNFVLSGESFHEKVGSVVLFPEWQEEPPLRIPMEVEETGKILPLARFRNLLSQKKFREKTVVFVVPPQSHSLKDWEEVFALARDLSRSQKAKIWVLAEEIMVAAPQFERLYRETRSEGALFEKTKISTIVLQPTLDMQGLWVEFETERDRYHQRFRADWVVYVPKRSPLPFGASSWWRGDAPIEVFFDLENPNLPRFSTSLQGVFIASQFDEEYFLELAQTVDTYLTQGKIAVSDCTSVEEEKCVLCLTCLRTCPWKAIEIEGKSKRKRAHINWEQCHLCGICMAFCPASAIGVNSLYPEDFFVITTTGSGEK